MPTSAAGGAADVDEGRPPARRLFRLGLGRPRGRQAVDWEIEHHLAELADRLVEKGWDPEAAARESERRFGGVRAYRRRLERIERRRAAMATWTGWVVAGWESLAGSVRGLRRQPGLSAGVVLTLGLGIGANAAMFTILDRLFFAPPAHVEAPDGVRRVVVVRSFLGRVSRGSSITHPDITDLHAVAGLEAVAAFAPREMTLGSGAEASKVRAVVAGHELFPLLRVRPAMGRFYGAEEDRPGAAPVAVLSREYWERAMGADPGALGSTLELGGAPFTVIGVAPEGFTGVDLAPVDVWIPLHTGGVVAQGGEEWRDHRGYYWLRAVARVRDGTAMQAVEDEATQLHRNARQEQIDRGRYDADVRVALDPLIVARGSEASAESRVARWLGGVSALLLLIVCANVANLLLARGSRRQREVAVRLALGVSRRRLVGRALLETVLLGLLGSGVALAVAYWGGEAIRRVLLPGVFFPAGLGGRVVAFTLALAMVAGALAGIAPALQSLRLDLARDLGQGSRGSLGRSRASDLLTVGQAALSVLLLVGAGLFVRSVGEVGRLDLGLDVDRLLLANLEFETGNLAVASQDRAVPMEDPALRNEVYARAMERLERLPGVASVAGTGSPFKWGFAGPLDVPGFDSLPDLPGGGPYFHDVTPGYFETVGLRILRGRGLLASDGAGAERVAVVSETMARTLWPDEDALGRCLLIGTDATECTTVAGVVEDASRGSLEEEPHMAYYLPIAQRDERRINGIYVRTAGDPADVAPMVASELRGLDPRVRFAEVETLREALDPQSRSWRLGAALFSVFGGLALLVAGIGLYSLLAFHVAQRTRELGIRAALGAAKAKLLVGVLGDGARLTAFGVGVGLALAVVLGRFAEPLLFRVSPRDPGVLVAVAGTLIAVGLAASLLPGLRATRVDPMDALRAE